MTAPQGRRIAASMALAALVLGTLGGGACGGGRPSAHGPAVDVKGGDKGGDKGGVKGGVNGGKAVAVGACPGATQPPGSRYTLTISGRITGTLTIRRDDNHSRYPAVIPKISARFCGSLDVASETGTVQPANISFAPTDIDLGYHIGRHGRPTELIQDPVAIVPVGAATATIVRTGAANGAAPDGGLELTLESQVDTIVFPAPPSRTIRCVDGPVTLDLSTETGGGSPLVGPLPDAKTTATETGFTIPAVAAGQKACYDGPGFPFAPVLNQLLYLPADDTATTETLTAHVAG